MKEKMNVFGFCFRWMMMIFDQPTGQWFTQHASTQHTLLNKNTRLVKLPAYVKHCEKTDTVL